MSITLVACKIRQVAEVADTRQLSFRHAYMGISPPSQIISSKAQQTVSAKSRCVGLMNRDALGERTCVLLLSRVTSLFTKVLLIWD